MAAIGKAAPAKGHRRVYSNSELTNETALEQNVIVVGAGMAGLTCARILLEEDPNCHVTLLEAHSSVGGRIQVDNDFVPGKALDVGAEYIHGTGTLLTHYIDEFRAAGLLQPTPRAKAIQQQIAKREEKKQKKLLHRRKPSYNPDDSDSSSDDGIMVFNSNEGGQQKPDTKPFLLRRNSASDLMEAADGGKSAASSLNSEKSFFEESRHTQHTQSSADAPAVPKEEESGNFFEEIFITAHADGGPNEHPTNEGKYGMYYVKGKLRMYDDPLTRPLDVAIESMLEQPPVSNNLSVHDALVRQLEKQQLLSTSKIPMPELYDLAVAGYGNTATITDLTQLSLPMLRIFENHWATAEEHGDLRLPAELGMYSVVQAMQIFLETTYSDRFRLLINAPVQEIDQTDKYSATVRYMTVATPTAGSPSSSASRLEEEFEMKAHRVVVAVPPPILPRIIPRLSRAKRQALEYISFSDIIKVVLKFNAVFWPEKLQSIVSGEGLFPELWFRPRFGGDDSANLVVFYLTDDYAQAFTEECQFENFADDSGVDWDKGKAADLCIQHLARVLSLEPEALKLSLLNTLIHDWKSQKYVGGGHMAPVIGMTMDHLRSMATPEGRVHFCGEATNTNACGTIQAAMETGVRAAKEVVYFGNKEREQKLKILKQKQLHQEQLQKEREEEAVKEAMKTEKALKPKGSQPLQKEEQKQKASEVERDTREAEVHAAIAARRQKELSAANATLPLENQNAVTAAPRQTAGSSPLEASKVIQRQMDLSRNLAKQEESSFHLINAMEQRQIELSRALLEQEEVSFQMIQTVEQLAAKCSAYEKQLGQAASNVDYEAELRNAKEDREAILAEHQTQMDKFETLQKRFKTLRQEAQEKDSVIEDQGRVIDMVSKKVLNLKNSSEAESRALRQELETKNKLINDRDAIIKIMAQKMSDMKGRAESAEIEAKSARDMVKDRDAVIRIISQRMESMKKQAKAQIEEARRQSSSVSPNRRMTVKQVKAEKEERLQEIMSRIRTTNKEKEANTAGRANRTPTKQLSKTNHVSPSSSSTAGTVMTEESNMSGGKSEPYALHKALY